MEAGIVLAIAVALVLCSASAAIGMRIGKNRKIAKEVIGNLNVDCSDPANGAYLYLELSVPIADVADRKQVMFNVRILN